MAVCDYTFDVTSQDLSPADAVALLKVQYSNAILEDRFATFGGINYFNPEVQQMELAGDLRTAQSLIVRYKNPQNPFDLVQVSDLTYVAGQECPAQLDVSCAGCISTVNSWRQAEVRFDKRYQVGASICREQEKFTYQTLEERFRESIEANNTVQGILAWNQFMCQALTAAQATQTLIPTDAACFPNHYYYAGNATTNGYEVLLQVYNYMKSVFGLAEFATFAHRQFEVDMAAPGATMWGFGPASAQSAPRLDGINTELTQGGWAPMKPFGGQLHGQTIYIAPDNIWFYSPTVNKTTGAITPGSATDSFNPFLSTDGDRYYVVIASRRSFYTGVVPILEAERSAGSCENNFTESVQSVFYGFNQLLFPREVFVIAFDMNCPAGPTP